MIGQYYVNNDRYAERLLQASCEVWCPLCVVPTPKK